MKQVAPSHPDRAHGLYPDAVALRAALTRKDISARAALEACFAEIDTRNDVINAVVYQDRDGARARADACDRADRPIGPLHGVPVTVKECFDWAGHPTTWGDPARAEDIRPEDSAVVARLKQAGAVIFGKTNIPPYLSDWETANPLFGSTRNPHDPAHSAGGSSGGSAAAVASGMSYIDIGSDQGVSIRYPAQCCGVYGLKPSWGEISLAGHSPLNERREPDIGAAGPLARSARDVALALSVLRTNPGPRKTTLPPKIRVAQLPPLPGCPIAARYQKALDGFAERLTHAGATVVHAQPDIDFDRATELMNLLVRAETARKSELVAQFRARQYMEPATRNTFADLNTKGTTLSHRDWLILHEERLELCQTVAAFFRETDILLCPAAAGLAPPFRLANDAAGRTVPVNGGEMPILKLHMLYMLGSLLYLPACTMPIGRIDGLPVGVQLIGASGSDDMLLAVASTFSGLAGI
ncbi:amidase family protein [Ruegeria sp.]|uniref:amidase family protein n=1 Tax=Ruegeria sp. TaxID=1879320 RepID=UPI00230B354A|nr:amidase family protein [Ruegeria sp.]MDA7965047.1 amidase family protein [Ruegeria sp.]